MANEYLKRTPTSTGNRKVFTWSAWAKRNNLTDGSQHMFSAGSQASNWGGIDLGDGEGLQFINVATSVNGRKRNPKVNRDSGSWIHYFVSVDTTNANGKDRIKIYENGVFISTIDTVDTEPALNALMHFNSTTAHHLGKLFDGASSFYFKGELSDVYLIDGQALTPDVFGFYKDGNGYISAGSTYATDFRPGQWVPKKPSVIKNTINNNGGFGVNGFYLPMNDSSNFGADFHCDPNSIITLQDETAAQPKNGAPDTTDAYVSQLRSDPYAANLVLAVPGISTSTSANLITNGTFESGTSNWTAQAGATLTNPNGVMRITATTTAGASQGSIPIVSGKRYTLSFRVRTDGTNFANFSLDLGGTVQYVGNQTSTDWINVTKSFTANTTGNAILTPYKATSGWVEIDNIVFKQEDAPRDYSADIKGSGSNKTLTPNGHAGVGYELGNYYGSAMTLDGNDDYFTLPANTSDLLLGSSDFTIECWVNRTNSGQQDVCGLFQTANNRRSYLLLLTDTQTVFYLNETGSSGINATATVSVPLNQWTHLAAERYGSNLTVYINGVAGAASTQANFTAYNNTDDQFMIGASDYSIANGSEFTGDIQDFRFYKGVAKYKGGFDVPKPYTPVGISTWRAVADCTANNFATLNPLANAVAGTLSNGNLQVQGTAANDKHVFSTIGFTSGKWYAEVRDVDQRDRGAIFVTDADHESALTGTNYFDVQLWDGGVATSGTNNTNLTAFSTGDILTIAYDADIGSVWLAKNGAVDTSGTANVTGISINPERDYRFSYRESGGNQSTVNWNFGQNPTFSGQVSAGATERNSDSNGIGEFRYAPPSGFLALCEDNLPAPAVADPGDYFKTVLWTGDGNSGRSITGLGFRPDLFWVKERSNTSGHHLFDSVRGPGLNLKSNATDAEVSTTTQLLSFDSDGFSVGSSGSHNQNGETYVAWCWKAGGAAVSNTDGTITSQVSANQDAGFSIATWTGNATEGATIGHGLAKAPGLVIVKNRVDSGASGATNGNWQVWHKSFTGQQYINLNLSNQRETETGGVTPWGATVPSSSVITLGGFNSTNGSGDDMIAYCWAEIEGFSKFGSYVGNASADGTFIYCGFKPAFVITKRTDGTSNWLIHDSSRDPVNPVMGALYTNESDTEGSAIRVDFVSNGFKHRNADGGTANNYANDYIFIAFAESPFKTANAK